MFYMRRCLFCVLLLALLADRGLATTIEINLGPGAVYTDANVGPISFSDLNGTLVNGSSLSIDFSFSGNEFVRLLANTTSLFEVALTLRTNAGNFPGVVTDPSGYLVDKNGNAIPNAGVTATTQGSNGTTFVGLFPLLLDSGGTPNPALMFPLAPRKLELSELTFSPLPLQTAGADATCIA
jgi:hypothetical protein